jgi:hypothetical protein
MDAPAAAALTIAVLENGETSLVPGTRMSVVED